MNVDTIIAEAAEEVAKEQQASQVEASAPDTETQQPPQAEAEPEKPELTPEQLEKKERNKISKLNSKLAEMKRYNRELQEKLAQYSQPQQTNTQQAQKVDGEPTPDDFETWEEYNRALVKYEAKQIREAEKQEAQKTQETQELTKWVSERSQQVDTRIIELAQTIPDFGQVIDGIDDLVGDIFGVDAEGNASLPPEIARVALEADDINLAAYTLHKEGKLLEVLKMPPMRAAMEIAKAEVRGQAYLKQPKPTTSAPAPLTPVKGIAAASVPLEKLDGREILRNLRN